MPWTAKTYRDRHNKHLTTAQAAKAASMANAMLKNGVPEGEAIATANKHFQRSVGKANKRYGPTLRDRNAGAELDSVVPQKGPRSH